MSTWSIAQTSTLKGIVQDKSGEPIIGANVMVKSSTTGTITDINGNFTIPDVPAGATLVVSYIGYINQEIAVKGQNNLIITLAEDTQTLDEVVVIGYGTVQKRDLTGSVVSIKQQDITAVPTTNPLESLQGKVAGLDLTKQSGEAGSGLSFTIRGNRSLNASNTPLVLVDGIPYSSGVDINPDAIESIEVLKDASSTAIYGSRGANGVILITTKKGKSGKTKISYSGYYSLNKAVGYPDRFNLQEWADLKREANRNVGQWSGPADDPTIFGAAYDYIKNDQYVDWVDLIMQDGHQTAHSVNLSGGTEKTRFNISLEYMNEAGLMKLDNMERYNAVMSLQHEISDKLELSTSAFYSYTDHNKRRDPYNAALKYGPYGDVYNEDGTINVWPFGAGDQTISPMAEEIPGAYKNNTVATNFLGNLSLKWNILKDLNAQTSFSFQNQNSRLGHYADQQSLDGAGEYSVADATNTIKRNITWENTVNYSLNINKHNIQVLAGNAVYNNVKEEFFGKGRNLISRSMTFYNLGATQINKEITSEYVEENMLSFFGRLNYKFNERYLLTGTMRYDGSSVLADGHKWGFFPSIAGAWRVNEEAFMQDFKHLSNLKLRVSYGISGNSAVSAYQTQGGLGQTMYSFNDGGAFGYYPRLTINEKLTWEKTGTTNIGVDFGFFNNRINGSIDYYIQKTTDLLMRKKIPTSNGYSVSWDNVGSTENKGIEISLNTQNILSKNFNWSTDWTFTRNREKIVELADGSDRDIENGWFVGQPIQVHYGLEKIGIWQLDEADEAAVFGYKPGDVKIKNQDNDDKITNDGDRVVLGTTRPDFIMGLNNQLNYKNFDLRVFAYLRYGQMISCTHLNFSHQGGEPGFKVDYWTPDNPTNAYPAPNKSRAKSDITMASLPYRDGSYLKIREITLGYTLPKSVLHTIGLDNVRFYCTLKNFFTFSHIDDYDPERGGAMTSPMSKQAVIGVNIDF